MKISLDPCRTISTDLRSTHGRLLSLDLGTQRVGIAVSDELRLSVRPLPYLRRTNWKQLLQSITRVCAEFAPHAVIVGLPLRLDGTVGDAALEARRVARNLALSLPIPVFLQDERLSSHAAEEQLRAASLTNTQIKEQIDSESAAIILRDFISAEIEDHASYTTGADDSYT